MNTIILLFYNNRSTKFNFIINYLIYKNKYIKTKSLYLTSFMKEKLNYLDCLFENLGLADSGD